jgi:hypothetical protein
MEKEGITKDEARRRLKVSDKYNIFKLWVDGAASGKREEIDQGNIMIESISDKKIDMKVAF